MSQRAKWFRWLARSPVTTPTPRPWPRRAAFKKRTSKPDSESSSQAGGMRDVALGTAGGLLLIGVGGVVYHEYYKWSVLRKIHISFKGGYDPILELDKAVKRRDPEDHLDPGEEDDEFEDAHLRRREQAMIDDIVAGRDPSHYYLVLGPKGAGKGTMIVDAIRKIQAEGASMCEAHEDMEVFRLRLGKCLNYEYHEDYYGGLFQRRDLREGGPLLDIERVMNKLEKVAIKYAKTNGRPLVLIINNLHLLHKDEEGYAVLHALQQRAEAWAAASVLNFVFVSDDFWVYDKLKKNNTRMHTITVGDLSRTETLSAIRSNRHCTADEANRIYDLLGGRLSLVSRILKSRGDLVESAEKIVEQEKSWLLARRAMIADHDDDVMDDQKEASCSWLLFQAFAEKAAELEKEAAERGDPLEHGVDPAIPYWQACVIMTRSDFIQALDHENIISIDVDHNVRADSAMLLNAMREVCAQEDFQEVLDQTRTRIDAIESLHRTRELTVKDNDGVFPISLLRNGEKVRE